MGRKEKRKIFLPLILPPISTLLDIMSNFVYVSVLFLGEKTRTGTTGLALSKKELKRGKTMDSRSYLTSSHLTMVTTTRGVKVSR